MSAAAIDLDWIISADDHVLEPGNVWQPRVPRSMRDAAPRLVHDPEGAYWLFEGARFPTMGLDAAAGKDVEQFSRLPLSFDDVRPGCYEPVARVADMDRDGVLAALCFPSFPRFCGQRFLEATDRELAFACVRAYNDWMIDEWCGTVPGRLIPLVIVPLWDAGAAAAEIERTAALGARAVSFSENPAHLGLPSLYDPDGFWDPMLAAAAETGTVICQHLGSSSNVLSSSEDAPVMSSIVWGTAAGISGAMVDWLLSGKLRQFPGLKISLAEGGVGWIPYFLDRAQRSYHRHRYWTRRGELVTDRASMLGSGADDEFDAHALFRDHIFGCMIAGAEPFAEGVIEQIGVDNVMVETDYPHSDCSWPHSLAAIRSGLAHLDPEIQFRIMQGNARRVFNFEPAIRSTHDATAEEKSDG